VKRRWVWLGVVLVVVAVVPQLALGASSGLLGDRFSVGELVQFRVVDDSTWWWGCCCCQPACGPSDVYGWRVADLCGVAVYGMTYEVPMPATVFLGSWPQVNYDGMQVAAGTYILYVDTSVGTLSRCFRIVDPCCLNLCWWCVSCHATSCFTNCGCTTSLEWVVPEPECCWPFWCVPSCCP